jgi:hypothetical protein
MLLAGRLPSVNDDLIDNNDHGLDSPDHNGLMSQWLDGTMAWYSSKPDNGQLISG